MKFTKLELQNLFRGYRQIDGRMKRTLKEWGFSLERQKTHVILVYRVGTTKLIFTTPKTASDCRAGLNFASVIYKRVYQAVYQAA